MVIVIYNRSDNWYENKQAPGQPQTDHREERFMRPREVDIMPQGHLKQLGRFKRVYKWDTKNVISDDGFRELDSKNRTDYQNPIVHRQVERKTEKMIQDVANATMA